MPLPGRRFTFSGTTEAGPLYHSRCRIRVQKPSGSGIIKLKNSPFMKWRAHDDTTSAFQLLPRRADPLDAAAVPRQGEAGERIQRGPARTGEEKTTAADRPARRDEGSCRRRCREGLSQQGRRASQFRIREWPCHGGELEEERLSATLLP